MRTDRICLVNRAVLMAVHGITAANVDHFFFLSSSAAWAAAKRATGTRYGEQLT